MSGKKILIVDDDQDLLLGLGARLKANSYSVVTAADAKAAISVARMEAPDLIILDLGLPGGDGFEVLERIIELGSLAAIPVIVLSAYHPAYQWRRVRDAGVLAFFQKPFENHEFLSVIRQALGEDCTVDVP
jgi:DNA-binding response OmpR family regulator